MLEFFQAFEGLSVLFCRFSDGFCLQTVFRFVFKIRFAFLFFFEFIGQARHNFVLNHFAPHIFQLRIVFGIRLFFAVHLDFFLHLEINRHFNHFVVKTFNFRHTSVQQRFRFVEKSQVIRLRLVVQLQLKRLQLRHICLRIELATRIDAVEVQLVNFLRKFIVHHLWTKMIFIQSRHQRLQQGSISIGRSRFGAERRDTNRANNHRQ